MSFFSIFNFLFLISPWPNLRINKQRDTSFEFSSSILSTVDLSKHLIMACIIRKFTQLDNFVTFSVFYFFFGNRVWLNLYERAFSGNETAIITGSFYFYYEDVRVRIYSMENLSSCLDRVRNARSAFYTRVRVLYPVRSP